MTETRYTDQHEWVTVDGDVATIGISKYATEQLGDVVYIELPEVGKAAAQFSEIAVVESVKAASEVYSPVSGKVVEINSALPEKPEQLNEDPQGAGWFAKLKLADAAELEKLMTEDAYASYVEGLS